MKIKHKKYKDKNINKDIIVFPLNFQQKSCQPNIPWALGKLSCGGFSKNPTEGGTTKNRNGIKIKTFTIEEMGWARLPLGSF